MSAELEITWKDGWRRGKSFNQEKWLSHMKQDSEHQAKQQYIKILQYCSSERNGNGQIYDRSGAKKINTCGNGRSGGIIFKRQKKGRRKPVTTRTTPCEMITQWSRLPWRPTGRYLESTWHVPSSGSSHGNRHDRLTWAGSTADKADCRLPSVDKISRAMSVFWPPRRRLYRR